MKHPLVKIAVLFVVLAAVVVLFVRSVHQTRAEPYTVSRAHLRGWTLALEPTAPAASPLLSLQVPQDLVADLSRQLFRRLMESLSSPVRPVLPLVLRSEYDRSLIGRLEPDALLEIARGAGLESARFEPACLGYRRISAPRLTRQLYFVLFESTEFARFRERLAGRAGHEFDPRALSPIVIASASDDRFETWYPLRADPEADCVAPVRPID